MGQIEQLARRKELLGRVVARMHQDCHRNVEDALFEFDGLKMSFNVTDSLRSGVCDSLEVVHERLQWKCGRLVAGHCWRDLFLISFVSIFVRVACFESNEGGADHVRLTRVIAPASESFRWESR